MMKTVMMFTLITLGTLTTHAAKNNVLVSDLLPKYIQSGQFYIDEIERARVVISTTKKQITLSVQPAWTCPEDRVCAAVMPQPLEFTLPLTSAAKGPCDTFVYIASEDKRSAGGVLTVIKVTDNANFYKNCMSFAPVDPVEVSYETAGFKTYMNLEFDYISTFKGEKLEKAKLP